MAIIKKRNKYTKLIKCRDTGETVKGYQNYLHTLHWQYLRKCVAYKARYKCQMCKKRVENSYTVHHLTYIRLGHEKRSDLMCLCSDCHAKVHSKNFFNKSRENT